MKSSVRRVKKVSKETSRVSKGEDSCYSSQTSNSEESYCTEDASSIEPIISHVNDVSTLPSWEKMSTMTSSLKDLSSMLQQIYDTVCLFSLRIDVHQWINNVFMLGMQNYFLYHPRSYAYDVSLILISMVWMGKQVMYEIYQELSFAKSYLIMGTRQKLFLGIEGVAITLFCMGCIGMMFSRFLSFLALAFMLMCISSVYYWVFTHLNDVFEITVAKSILRSVDATLFVWIVPILFRTDAHLIYNPYLTTIVGVLCFLNNVVLCAGKHLALARSPKNRVVRKASQWKLVKQEVHQRKPMNEWKDEKMYFVGDKVEHEGRTFLAVEDGSSRPRILDPDTALYVQDAFNLHLYLNIIHQGVLVGLLSWSFYSPWWESVSLLQLSCCHVAYLLEQTRQASDPRQKLGFDFSKVVKKIV